MPSLSQLITPDYIVRHVSDVTPDFLRDHGIVAIVSDLDNTLVGWHGHTTEPEVAQWLAQMHDSNIQICIASNTHRLDRLARVASAQRILHVPANCGKPGTRGIRKALALLGATPEQTVMVGDQVFTDIVAGNRAGLTTVLVNPLSPHEFIGTRIVSRTAERWVLRGARRRPE